MTIPITCEACKAEGSVENPSHMERVSCPCGALYLYWPDGEKYGEKSPWKCVVKPIFELSSREGGEAPKSIT